MESTAPVQRNEKGFLLAKYSACVVVAGSKVERRQKSFSGVRLCAAAATARRGKKGKGALLATVGFWIGFGSARLGSGNPFD